MTALKTRPPTGRVPWPLILIEGGEKSGKSWMAATLSASDRIGHTAWIDLGEGAGDEYGAIPGVRYQVVLHDGTWLSILEQVEGARDEAKKALEAGDPPFVLVIDSMTLIWDMLKDWASNRARKTESNRKKLREDPNAEIVVATNFWNDANARHRKLMTMLMTFPGIVVAIARGKEVAELDAKGAPIAGRKGYRVEGHKDLAFDATVWLRVSRDDEPLIVGCRSVHAGIRPGNDKARRLPGLELERLIFDVLRCDPATATPRDLVPLQAGDAAPDGEAPGPTPMTSVARTELARLLRDADMTDRDAALLYINGIITPAHVDGTKELTAEQGDMVLDRLRKYVAQQTPPDPAASPAREEPEQLADTMSDGADTGTRMVSDAQHRHMHALWRELGYDGDHNRVNRLTIINKIIRRAVTSSKELTEGEADGVVAALESKRRELKQAAPQAPQPESPMTPVQRTEMFELLNTAGFGNDQAKALAAINTAIAPATATTTKTLTEFQAAQVIGHLKGLRTAVPA